MQKSPLARAFRNKVEDGGKLFSAVVHYAKPNFAEIVHAHVRFLVVLLKDSLVLVGEKPVEAKGLVQGCMRFLEVTYGKEIVAQIQAVGSENTMPFPIRQARASGLFCITP